MSEKVLPLILVSAVDLATASKVITELIDNEVTDGESRQGGGRVWRLVNKYYRADVELRPAADGAPPPASPERVEAHVIYVAEQGAAEAAAAEARRAGAGAAAGGAAVRLVLTPGARASAALAGWARRRGYEPVPLAERAPPEPAAGPPPDAVGVRRARDALHAHTWRGLVRLDRAHAAPTGDEAAADEESGGECGEESGDEGGEFGDECGEGEGAVERAEAFATALGALAAARDAPAPGDEERRRRAERLVLAFCRALGADAPRP